MHSSLWAWRSLRVRTSKILSGQPLSTVGDVHFVDRAYASVLWSAGTAAQVQHFVDQLNFFETLYTTAGTFGSASNIDLLARGAMYGQMLGIEHESAPIGSEPEDKAHGSACSRLNHAEQRRFFERQQ